MSSNVTYNPTLTYDPVERVTFRHPSGNTEYYLIKDKYNWAFSLGNNNNNKSSFHILLDIVDHTDRFTKA